MVIKLTHFDTRTRTTSDIEETVTHSIAEYLFPDAHFAIGKVYPDDIQEHDLRDYNGMSLQFSSGQRMYFSDKQVREQLFPQPSDGAVYGSLPFTPCKDFLEVVEARILIIDHETGATSSNPEEDMIARNEAKLLVDDCWGQISQKLATEIVGDKHTPFQYRLGIKPQPESPVFRIAKGTFAPYNPTDSSEEGYAKILGRYDLIIPTSSFKGRKGETAITPGEYTLTVGIALKVAAEYTRFSLGTQILSNYPEGVRKDILPVVEHLAKELAKAQKDQRSLARRLVESEKERRQFRNQLAEDEAQVVIDDLIGTAFDVDITEESQGRTPLYEVIEKDINNY